MARVAQEFPKTGFAIVDAVVDNLMLLLWSSRTRGSFLVGALAAMMTYRKSVPYRLWIFPSKQIY